jgi:hypothetical protein
MSRYILVALVAYLLGSNVWAYPTHDGITFGLGEFGFYYSYNKES